MHLEKLNFTKIYNAISNIFQMSKSTNLDLPQQYFIKYDHSIQLKMTARNIHPVPHFKFIIFLRLIQMICFYTSILVLRLVSPQ